MINITKKALLSILAVGTIISITALGANTAFADDTDFRNPIISRLAEKFGLNEDEVEAVFDAVHEERQTQMQQNHEERLNQAVEDGVITEEQKNALLEKQQNMWQERSLEREQHREEMDAWFEEQGIDHEALIEYMGGFGMHGKFGHRLMAP